MGVVSSGLFCRRKGNYRGIVLLESLYKAAAIILHDRLKPVIESIDHEEQCGFRSQRGCTDDGTFTVKMAIKKRREHSRDLDYVP